MQPRRSIQFVTRYAREHSAGLSLVVPLGGAVAAAFLVFFLRWAIDSQWLFLSLADDLTRNLLIGGLLAVAGAGLRSVQADRDRQAAIDAAVAKERRQAVAVGQVLQAVTKAWDPGFGLFSGELPDQVPGMISGLHREAAKLKDKSLPLAATVGWVAGSPRPGMYRQIPEAIFGLLKGRRAAYFSYVDLTQRALANMDSPADKYVEHAVWLFRQAAAEGDARRAGTDAALAETFLTGAIGDTAPSREERSDLAPLAADPVDAVVAVFEPLYLLGQYCITHNDDFAADELPRDGLVVIKPCIVALHREIWALAAALERLAEFLEIAMSRDPRRAAARFDAQSIRRYETVADAIAGYSCESDLVAGVTKAQHDALREAIRQELR